MKREEQTKQKDMLSFNLSSILLLPPNFHFMSNSLFISNRTTKNFFRQKLSQNWFVRLLIMMTTDAVTPSSLDKNNWRINSTLYISIWKKNKRIHDQMNDFRTNRRGNAKKKQKKKRKNFMKNENKNKRMIFFKFLLFFF